MQYSILYLRLTQELRLPLPPTEVLQRVQQATTASTACGAPLSHNSAALFQGWIKTNSFRISLLTGKSGRHHQLSVVVEGEVVANDMGGSQLRLLYRPLLMQLFVLGFWLIFGGTAVLVSLLEWLHGPQASFSWGPAGVFCAFYGLAVLSFWWDARRSRRQLIPLLCLGQPDTPPVF
jgi:hypothetical protein